MRDGQLLNTHVGDYRLIDFLGKGGMGEVYRAVHAKIGKVVAVKVLTEAGKSRSMIERFNNEARIQARLNHPRIAALHDFLELNGQPCIIMEYVDGHTIDDCIRSFGPIPARDALRIFQSIVDAISYIHSNGIIHRDIKSNNIKITSTGEVKLLDFGIAKSGSSPNLTVTGDVFGTLQYLSPEQLKGGTADARSDIWALGILLYEMVSADVPFKATTIGDLCDKIMKGNYTPPSALNANVPASFDAIISRCLKKNPSSRYQSAQELLNAVAQVAAAVNAPSPSRQRDGATIPASAKRWWPILSAGVGALLVLAIVGFYILGGDNNLNRNENRNANRAAITNSNSTLKVSSVTNENRGVTQSGSGTETVVTTIDVDEAIGRAEVFVNGENKGPTPYHLEGRHGQEFDIMVKKQGFEDFRIPSFRVSVGKTQYLISTGMMRKKQ